MFLARTGPPGYLCKLCTICVNLCMLEVVFKAPHQFLVHYHSCDYVRLPLVHLTSHMSVCVNKFPMCITGTRNIVTITVLCREE